MAKYRKKPVVIEAIRFWNGDGRNTIKECEEFCGGKYYDKKDGVDNDFFIKTLEGPMMAVDGDYIIKGIKGEFYPCHPDIFHQTYELVEEN